MSQGLEGPGPDDRPQPEGRRNTQGIRIDPVTEAELEPRRAVISTLVAHEPGVLAKVSGLFARRQFNIESLAVGPTHDPEYARITLVVEEPDPGIEQVKKQLAKLLPVIAVDELQPDATRRELALIKVSGEEPEAVHAVAEMYDANVVDTSDGMFTVEVTGSEQKVEAAVETFDRFDIKEIARTGAVAMARGADETANGR